MNDTTTEVEDLADLTPDEVHPSLRETLNLGRINVLRRAILRVGPGHFNMGMWLSDVSVEGLEQMRSLLQITRKQHENDELQHSCDSAGCIGGWTAALFYREVEGAEDAVRTGDIDNDDAWVAKILGLSERQAYALCYPAVADRWGNITPEEAVETIDRFVRTGVINWNTED